MQILESDVDAPPELVREEPPSFPLTGTFHIAAASADRHEGVDIVLDIERVHCYYGGYVEGAGRHRRWRGGIRPGPRTASQRVSQPV